MLFERPEEFDTPGEKIFEQERHDHHRVHQLVDSLAERAREALIREVDLTPKPGLVDLRNTGAHKDMDHRTFLVSADAIAPYLKEFCLLGLSMAHIPASLFLPLIRPVGITCEQAMFDATGNVNTHKGAIFSMGLLCATAGRLVAEGSLPTRKQLFSEAAVICTDLVAGDLEQDSAPRTVGERLFRQYGLTGIRGEAASGYATVRNHALPVFDELIEEGHSEEIALLQSLLSLMAHNQDTNLIGRGGIEGLGFVRRRSAELLNDGGVLASGGIERMAAFDDELIAMNLSPGGSADLLAVCWFSSYFTS